MKLYGSELFQRIGDLALDILGPFGRVWEAEENGSGRNWPKLAVTSRAYTILGGTSEIQRNIIAERILGLPKA